MTTVNNADRKVNSADGKVTYDSIIFDGGGILSISTCSVVKTLDSVGIIKNVKRYAGSSSGSILATLMAVGYSGREIEDILPETNIKNFANTFMMTGLYNLYKYYGYNDGSYLENWISNKIITKIGHDITFEKLYSQKGIILVITGTNISDNKIEYFSYLSTPTMNISKAVRISCSFPFVFYPVKYQRKLYIDGGILTSFPENAFDEVNKLESTRKLIDEIFDDNNIIGIKFKKGIIKKEPNSLIEYFKKIIDSISPVKESKININNIIEIDTGDIDTMNFDITPKQKSFLINQGARAVYNFIDRITRI